MKQIVWNKSQKITLQIRYNAFLYHHPWCLRIKTCSQNPYVSIVNWSHKMTRNFSSFHTNRKNKFLPKSFHRLRTAARIRQNSFNMPMSGYFLYNTRTDTYNITCNLLPSNAIDRSSFVHGRPRNVMSTMCWLQNRFACFPLFFYKVSHSAKIFLKLCITASYTILRISIILCQIAEE